MDKSLPRQILEHLAICGSRLMLNSFFAPYGQSLGQAIREAERLAARCPHDFSIHSKNTVSVALHRMKKQKLLTVTGSKKKAIWRITQKGKNHFEDVKDRDKNNILPAEDGKTRLVVFDIPESRAVERNWLRRELLACDYTPLQKSVFMGLRPLPAKLLKDIKERELFSHIHVVGLENE